MTMYGRKGALFNSPSAPHCPLASSPSAAAAAVSYLVTSLLSLARPLISAVGEACRFTMRGVRGMDGGRPAVPRRRLYNSPVKALSPLPLFSAGSAWIDALDISWISRRSW